MNEVIGILKSPELKGFGRVIGVLTILGIAAFVYDKIITVRNNRQLYYLNKLSLTKLNKELVDAGITATDESNKKAINGLIY